ncbi:MAG: hypothetical protein NVSMB48_10820 [Marmoricola sp.]
MAATTTPTPPLNSEELLGPHLGRRYRIIDQVGRGGMATVYHAHDDHLDRDVALKVFHPGLTSTADLQRQQAEIRHFAGLTHPSLVTLYDAIADQDDRTILVLEYVAGRDLRTRLTRGPMGPAAVAAVGRDIARALAHVHSRNVVHRDVSPGNILLPDVHGHDHDVAAKLTDLGIARFLDAGRLTVTGTLVGTVAYLSPEQVQGEELTVACDVYSLGLVLLECLTGRREFAGPATEAALARLGRDPIIPEHLSPAWRDLLAAMCARRAADRPSAAEAAAVLATIATTAALAPATESIGLVWSPDDAPTVVAAPLPTGLATSSRFRSRPVLVTAVAGLPAIAVLLVLGVTGSGNPPATPAPSPTYPSITGKLGTDLHQLERAVSPTVRQ